MTYFEEAPRAPRNRKERRERVAMQPKAIKKAIAEAHRQHKQANDPKIKSGGKRQDQI